MKFNHFNIEAMNAEINVADFPKWFPMIDVRNHDEYRPESLCMRE